MNIAVSKYKGNWKRIVKYLEDHQSKGDSRKTVDDCKKRYIALSKGALHRWNEKEDQKLIDLVSKYGKNWWILTKHFNGLLQDKIRKRYEYIIQLDKYNFQEDAFKLQEKLSISNLPDEQIMEFRPSLNYVARCSEQSNFSRFSNSMRVDTDNYWGSITSDTQFFNVLKLKICTNCGKCISSQAQNTNLISQNFSIKTIENPWMNISNQTQLWTKCDPNNFERISRLSNAICDLLEEDTSKVCKIFTPIALF